MSKNENAKQILYVYSVQGKNHLCVVFLPPFRAHALHKFIQCKIENEKCEKIMLYCRSGRVYELFVFGVFTIYFCTILQLNVAILSFTKYALNVYAEPFAFVQKWNKHEKCIDYLTL